MKKNRIKVITGMMAVGILLCAMVQPATGMSLDEATEWTESLPEEGWPQPPNLHSQSAIVVEVETGSLLYAKNATKKMYPASTTKLLTALLTLENGTLDDIISYSWKAVNSIGQNASHIGMRTGEQLSVRDSLYGLLLPSANEAANALAEYVAGSVEDFADLMNRRASELGAVNSHFQNANGLHEEGHYTCAYDLYLIMNACVMRGDFIEIDSAPAYFRQADEILPKDIPMGTTNMLIKNGSEYYNDAVVCGKTGYTPEAGRVLVTYAVKDDMELISVVMGGENQDHFTDTNVLLEYAYQNFKKTQIGEGDGRSAADGLRYSTPLGIPRNVYQLVQFEGNTMGVLPKDAKVEDLERSFVTVDGKKDLEYRFHGHLVSRLQMSEPDDVVLSNLFLKQSEYQSEMGMPDGTMQVWYVIAIVVMGIIGILVFFLIRAIMLQKKPRHIPRNKAGNLKFHTHTKW